MFLLFGYRNIRGAMSCNTRAQVFLYIALVTGIISSLHYRMELVTVHEYFRLSILRFGGFVLLE